MKALSIRQPWAWAIINAGKDVENRTWATKFRGDVLLHASARADADADEILSFIKQQFPAVPVPPAMHLSLGGIIGVARIVDCIQTSESFWAMEGCHHFVLADVRPLPLVKCTGALGFWEVPQGIMAAVRPALNQIGRAA